jgi:predicted DNA-binding transcriptional regulator AlpA
VLLVEIRDLLEAQTRPMAELLDRHELAALLGMGQSTLDRAKAAGQIGPKPFQCSGLKWHRAAAGDRRRTSSG